MSEKCSSSDSSRHLTEACIFSSINFCRRIYLVFISNVLLSHYSNMRIRKSSLLLQDVSTLTRKLLTCETGSIHKCYFFLSRTASNWIIEMRAVMRYIYQVIYHYPFTILHFCLLYIGLIERSHLVSLIIT